MTVEFFVVIFLTRYFRKVLQPTSRLPKWDKILTALMAVAIASIVLELAASGSKNILIWLAHLMLLFFVYISFTYAELKPVRSIINAVLPFIIISLISDVLENLFPSFYGKWNDYFENAILFSLLWLFAMWQVANRQKKALEKERLKTEEKEAEIRITSALKEQLEMQVAERTAALTRQKEELEHALAELQATQAQLIQSEKMASLGELTAGIAHEIQNPLNFVNNFSEINSELIAEMKEEIEKGNIDEVKAIAADIKENQEKINHHGKRADAIVKGMLQHSRVSTGKKELTDINALADEYIRLSYHGLRAKDKSFNADFKTDFDENIGKIAVVPQDLGRVLLNLFNNAFYSVNEKKKILNGTFEPMVTVTTRQISNAFTGGTEKVEIVVRDNGSGIPEKVMDKIYQPFFTTKPTGQGTGLGLSITYDIITKVHGGEMKVDTREGEGAAFTIILPITR